MDLALLQQMKNQTQDLAINRRQNSDEFYQQGIELLAQAQAQEFADKESLKEASKLLMRSIQYGRQNAEPYIAMGYLMILLGDMPNAVRYLGEARRVDPDNTDVIQLINFLQRPAGSQDDEDALDKPDFGEGNEEIEQNYERVQKLIIELNQKSNQLPTAPAFGPQEFRVLEETHQFLELNLQEAYQLLEALELDLDVSSLSQQLRPVEQALQQTAQLRRISGRVIRMQQQMMAKEQEIQAEIGVLIGATAELNQRLEDYLDQCDLFADQLDEVDELGHGIAPLEPYYNKLVATVESFQDYIDDLAD